jgi:hypothetical protein
MTIKVLVAVKIPEADEFQLDIFEAEMARRQWVKYPHVPDTYCVDFSGSESDSDVLAASEADVTEAAEIANLYCWDGICVLADEG